MILDTDNPSLVQSITGEPQPPTNRPDAEASIVAAINSGRGQSDAFFAGAIQARHLIRENRLDSGTRQRFAIDAPEERLQQYIVISYTSIAHAKSAKWHLQAMPGVRHVSLDKRMNLLWQPNDPYFPIPSGSPEAGHYQWGLPTMRFPQAWDKSLGHGQVGVIDSGLVNNQAPPDLEQNYRSQFSLLISSPSPPLTLPARWEFHGTHVLGIIAATTDNSIGTAGACPRCSATMITVNRSISSIAEGISALIDRGMQVINMSFGQSTSCSDPNWLSVCDAISSAGNRDVLLVAAAGNTAGDPTDFPANHSSVLSAGGVMNTNPSNPNPSNWSPWDSGDTAGSSDAGINGVMAPARSIVSTVPAGSDYITDDPATPCSDNLPIDESGVDGDGYGSCTGTSMASPHVAALGGILRSINPRLSSGQIQNIIRNSGTHSNSPSQAMGHGLPRADLAVNAAIAQTPNRLTPLFSLYSSGRLDYFYTTVPQMASAATWGTLQPHSNPGLTTGGRYTPAGLTTGGSGINGYSSFPGAYSHSFWPYTPLAPVWIFTTPKNLKSSTTPLAPLYRLSWKCGDPTPSPPAVCSSTPNHTDTTYTADPNGVTAFQSWGYKLDGIEGYIYPKSLPQPNGTVKLMRKYNPDRDDHAIFPEAALQNMLNEGYTENSGSDWLGYVYPNNTGNPPFIW